MKTNQRMTITFAGGDLQIDHRTEMGSLVDVFAIGNKYRALEGLKVLRHDQWLALEGTKNFIALMGEKLGREPIRTKSGRGGGIWAHLYILMDAAAYLSPSFKYEVYEKFITEQILEWRDRSGNNFIEMNAAIAGKGEELFGGPPQSGHYIQIADIIRNRCRVVGWNLASRDQLRERARIEQSLAQVLKLGLVKDWNQLRNLAGEV